MAKVILAQAANLVAVSLQLWRLKTRWKNSCENMYAKRLIKMQSRNSSFMARGETS